MDSDTGFNSQIYGFESMMGQYDPYGPRNDPYGPRNDPYGQRYGQLFDRRRRQPGYIAGGSHQVDNAEDEDPEKPDFPFLYYLRNNYR